MVCLGNICRSPLAEGILKSKLPLDNFTVDSAGTSNYHIGELPDNRSIAIAKTHGIDITDQRGRQFFAKAQLKHYCLALTKQWHDRVGQRLARWPVIKARRPEE